MRHDALPCLKRWAMHLHLWCETFCNAYRKMSLFLVPSQPDRSLVASSEGFFAAHRLRPLFLSTSTRIHEQRWCTNMREAPLVAPDAVLRSRRRRSSCILAGSTKTVKIVRPVSILNSGRMALWY